MKRLYFRFIPPNNIDEIISSIDPDTKELEISIDFQALDRLDELDNDRESPFGLMHHIMKRTMMVNLLSRLPATLTTISLPKCYLDYLSIDDLKHLKHSLPNVTKVYLPSQSCLNGMSKEKLDALANIAPNYIEFIFTSEITDSSYLPRNELYLNYIPLKKASNLLLAWNWICQKHNLHPYIVLHISQYLDGQNILSINKKDQLGFQMTLFKKAKELNKLIENDDQEDKRMAESIRKMASVVVFLGLSGYIIKPETWILASTLILASSLLMVRQSYNMCSEKREQISLR